MLGRTAERLEDNFTHTMSCDKRCCEAALCDADLIFNQPATAAVLQRPPLYKCIYNSELSAPGCVGGETSSSLCQHRGPDLNGPDRTGWYWTGQSRTWQSEADFCGRREHQRQLV